MLCVMSPGELQREKQPQRGRKPGGDVPVNSLRNAWDAQAVGCSGGSSSVRSMGGGFGRLRSGSVAPGTPFLRLLNLQSSNFTQPDCAKPRPCVYIALAFLEESSQGVPGLAQKVLLPREGSQGPVGRHTSPLPNPLRARDAAVLGVKVLCVGERGRRVLPGHTAGPSGRTVSGECVRLCCTRARLCVCVHARPLQGFLDLHQSPVLLGDSQTRPLEARTMLRGRWDLQGLRIHGVPGQLREAGLPRRACLVCVFSGSGRP